MQHKIFWLLFLVFSTVVTGCGSGGNNGSTSNGSSDGRIQILTRTYSFGVGLTPIDMAVAPNGDVFLCFANTDAKQGLATKGLIKFTNFGKPVGDVPQQGVALDPAEYEKAGIQEAAAIAVSPRDGTVYVLDNAHGQDSENRYIVAFSREGRFLFRFRHPEGSVRRISSFKGHIAVDRTGKIYVKESHPEEYDGISVFDAFGNYLRTLHPPRVAGSVYISTFALDKNNNLYVAVSDTEGPISGTRISVFSASGQFVRDFRVKLNLREVSTFAVGNRGNLYFGIGSGYVQKSSAEGEPIADYVFPSSPTCLVLDASDNLYVNRGTFSETNRISVFKHN